MEVNILFITTRIIKHYIIDSWFPARGPNRGRGGAGYQTPHFGQPGPVRSSSPRRVSPSTETTAAARETSFDGVLQASSILA